MEKGNLKISWKRVRLLPRAPLNIAFGVLFLVVFALDVYMMALLKKYNAAYRMISVSNLDSLQTSFSGDPTHLFADEFTSHDYRVLLREVMDKVSRSESFYSKDVAEIYRHVSAGGGTNCSGMADLYFFALRKNNIKARRIALMRDMFGIWDSHTSVEVFIDGKWIIVDPTFNVTFERNGALLGAQEIKQAYIYGEMTYIKAVFHGQVAYPARLDTYYMKWAPLFCNVFVMDLPPKNLLARIPPFRYWFGPKYYYVETDDHGFFHILFQRNLYMVFVAIIPCIIILLAAWLGMLGFRRVIRKMQRSTNSGIVPGQAEPVPERPRKAGRLSPTVHKQTDPRYQG